MLKPQWYLDGTKRMRHLIVPSVDTQHWLNIIKANDWVNQGIGIITLEGGMKAIPLNEKAPKDDDKIWQNHIHQEILREGVKVRHWSDYLNKEVFEKLEQYLPKSYEMIGDLLVVRLEDQVRNYQNEIAQAMLKRISKARIVCADNGVEGEFRVRNLIPIMSRDGSLSTLTKIKENGQQIIIDPTKSYFSSRLSTEREGTVVSAVKLSKHLGRPLSVIDPYAGVGPAFAGLLSEPDLIEELYVGDLNPEAVILLRKNIDNFTTKHNSNLKTSYISCQDARKWQLDEALVRKADLLLANLPHDIINHFSDLLPLMKKGHKTLIRGWAIINRDQLTNLKTAISKIILKHDVEGLELKCQEIKGFSATKIYVRIETWQTFL